MPFYRIHFQFLEFSIEKIIQILIINILNILIYESLCRDKIRKYEMATIIYSNPELLMEKYYNEILKIGLCDKLLLSKKKI